MGETTLLQRTLVAETLPHGQAVLFRKEVPSRAVLLERRSKERSACCAGGVVSLWGPLLFDSGGISCQALVIFTVGHARF